MNPPENAGKGRAWGVFLFACVAAAVQTPQLYRGLMTQIGAAPPAESLERLMLLRAAGGSIVITLALGFLAHEISWAFANRAPFRRLLLSVWVGALVTYAAYAYETAPTAEATATLVLTLLVELLVSAVAVAHVARALHASTLHASTLHADTPHADTPHADTPHADTPHADTPHIPRARARPPAPRDTPFACSCGRSFAKQQGLAAHIGNNPGHSPEGDNQQ